MVLIIYFGYVCMFVCGGCVLGCMYVCVVCMCVGALVGMGVHVMRSY